MRWPAIAIFLASLFVFAGMSSAETPILNDPSLSHVANLAHGGGAGIWVRDGFVYHAGYYANSFAVIDATDPENPVIRDQISVRGRDTDLLETQGRLIAVLADGGPRMHFVDVTDPDNIFLTATLSMPSAVHNIAVVAGTTLVYNSRSTGTGIDIVDAADPAAPVVVKTAVPGSFSCHDITTYPEVGKAYCAGLYATFVLDITDPLDPVTTMTLDDPNIILHHWALASQDHDIVMIGDEAFGANNGCMDAVVTPLFTESSPYGAITFFDVSSGEPVKIGHVSMPYHPPGAWCTAHFGQVIGDRTLLAVGWYAAGVALIDWDGPLGPRIVDTWETGNTNTWDVRYEDGYLYTGDINRGMDVLRLEPELLPPL